MQRRITIKAPLFWYHEPGILSWLLMPLSAAYAAVGCLRFKFITPEKLPVPVICMGNLVVGGAGKTPTTIALAHHLQEMGKNPHILSRGYGSHVDIPTLVDLKLHKASDVGDEPLLLAQTAPTWVFKDRVTSGRMAIDAGADVLIMDDGFQNPTIYKDLSFIVVDGKQGFGNGCVLPAGPLRENISQGLKRADAIIMIGDNQQGLKFDIPVLQANIQCLNPNPQNVYAFTGLGFPEKFFQTLRELRYEVVQTKSFADHHPYTRQEIDDLIKSAADLNVRLITTEKDALRIFLDQMPFIDVLNVELIFNNTDQLNTMLHKVHS